MFLFFFSVMEVVSSRFYMFKPSIRKEEEEKKKNCYVLAIVSSSLKTYVTHKIVLYKVYGLYFLFEMYRGNVNYSRKLEIISIGIYTTRNSYRVE